MNCILRSVRHALVAAFFSIPYATVSGQVLKFDAPNVVTISSDLVTAGQPTAKALAELKAQGIGGVIYLAPSTVSDAVPDEQAIVERQGIKYVNIPINFSNPTASDFDSFVAAMSELEGRKVLVHCQVNMRASSMTFLYRVIIKKEDPEKAYDAVAAVWLPHGLWKAYLVAQLQKHKIAFQPY